MYDKVTMARVVPANYFWNQMSNDQLLDYFQSWWAKPKTSPCLSSIKAGIAQLQSRGILTAEETAACLKETLKMRAKAQRNERNNHE